MAGHDFEKTPDLKGLSLLIADGDPGFVRETERELSGFGASVVTAFTADQAMGLLFLEPVDILVVGLGLMREPFFDELRKFRATHPDSLLYLVTEEGETAETSASAGIHIDDYLQKPLDPDRLARIIETSVGRPHTGSTSLALLEPLVKKVKPYFIFRSGAMRRALYRLPEIAASGQTVLISGETGTGKELVARGIHVLSSRSTGPFMAINCGAIPETLIEGELFGHEKGAFTGAYASRKGKFEAAHRGTLFLDEIGDMPLNLQVRLLRVLEEGKIYRIGGESPVSVDVRVIAATRVELEKMVEDGLFRDDLFYRLNVLRIHLPPLRERVDDISLLAVHFLERAFSEMGRTPPYPSLSSETLYLLEHAQWKGNVRELRNIMTRIATLLPPGTKRIFPFHVLPHIELPRRTEERVEPMPEQDGIFIPGGSSLDEIENTVIQQTLKKTGGNRSRAAKLLGISLRTLRRKLNKKTVPSDR